MGVRSCPVTDRPAETELAPMRPVILPPPERRELPDLPMSERLGNPAEFVGLGLTRTSPKTVSYPNDKQRPGRMIVLRTGIVTIGWRPQCRLIAVGLARGSGAFCP
jgi:hypothetical protein